MRGSSRGESRALRPKSISEADRRVKDGDKPLGVQFAMNGTIKEINLDAPGRDLKTKLVNDKASLICIFEETFGANKP